MSKQLLVIGSGNPGKAAELAELLRDLPYDVKGLRAFPPVPEPEETGRTFKANALLKAVYYAGHFEAWCVADDSGLEVDALDGAPGVYSARYAGPENDDAKNVAKLLGALEGAPEAKRTARFVCCAALVRPNAAPHFETGTVEGRIIFEPRGEYGFGYDPVFVPEDAAKTFAEMQGEEKHAISHRGRALKKMRAFLAALP